MLSAQSREHRWPLPHEAFDALEDDLPGGRSSFAFQDDIRLGEHFQQGCDFADDGIAASARQARVTGLNNNREPMPRQILSLLLMPSLLMGQLASHGHSHDEGQPDEHDHRTHFHMAYCCDDHHHGGHHDHHDDSDADGDHHDDLTTEVQESVPTPDHDSDAIYVGATDYVAAGGSHQKVEQVASFALAIPDRDLVARTADDPLGRSKCRGPAPPSCGIACPLFVRHLALLI